MSYHITLRSNAVYLAGFNPDAEEVTFTRDSDRARQFPSLRDAQRFVDTYADEGWGLETKDALIVPARGSSIRG